VKHNDRANLGLDIARLKRDNWILEYNAGKYHNGGRDVREGDEAAEVSAASAIITAILFVLLFLGV